MHYRRGDFGLSTLFVKMWTWIAALWQPPARPLSDAGRIALRLVAGGITVLSITAGIWFWRATFNETEIWARFTVACLTFGLFGLPSSIVAIVVGAVMVHARASMGAGQSAAVLLLPIAYFVQWLTLSWALLRRSMR